MGARDELHRVLYDRRGILDSVLNQRLAAVSAQFSRKRTPWQRVTDWFRDFWYYRVLRRPRPELSKIILPILRRVMPTIIANEIIGVQPMQGPVGGIFSMRRSRARWTWRAMHRHEWYGLP